MLRSRIATSIIRRDSVRRSRFPAAALRRVAVALVIGVCGLSVAVDGSARVRRDDRDAIGVVRLAELPPQGRQVLDEIRAGGPFVSRRDGIVFGNREGLLPRQPRGYYSEYTVPTPGAADRGTRRIVAGRGAAGDVRTSNEYYFTNDHYQSFRRIVQ